MSLWKDTITWAEELNVKYFNHPIQVCTFGFDSCVLGKEEKSEGLPISQASLAGSARSQLEYAWGQSTITAWFLSMFSGAHLGLCSPSINHSPALSQFFPLPDPADSWVLPALAVRLWDLNVPSSHYRKLDSFFDIHLPFLNCHIGIYHKIQGLKSCWKVIIRQPSTAAWNKLKSLSWCKHVGVDKKSGPVTYMQSD